MNREDIIRMAREAGFQCLLPSEHTAATGCIYDSGDDEITPLLERFAALVASAERESLRESFRVVTAAEASAAILHEREACAKVCEKFAGNMTVLAEWGASQCANAIRARGQS